MLKEIRPYLSNKSCKQITSKHYLYEILESELDICNILDLGCGDGSSSCYVHDIDPKINWYGLEIEKRKILNLDGKSNTKYTIYDGRKIPFEEEKFDIIYCNQVFEHVRYPIILLEEIERVLKPGGYFIGSVSHLEPYHGNYWNFTPYGFSLIVNDAGLKMVEMRPSIDGLSLLLRTSLNKPKSFASLWETETPVNKAINLFGKLTFQKRYMINFLKLVICGHFCFKVVKE